MNKSSGSVYVPSLLAVLCTVVAIIIIKDASIMPE